MFKCEICKQEFQYSSSIGNHVKSHDITPQIYYDLYILSDNSDKCIVCGSKSKFISLVKGYQLTCNISCRKDIPGYRDNMSIIKKGCKRPDIIGENNPSKRADVRKILSDRMLGNTITLGRKLSAKQRAEQSERIKNQWIGADKRKLNLVTNHSNNPSRYKQGKHISTKTGRILNYHSSYELVVYRKLDLDKSVKDYIVEFVAIPYIGVDGKEHHYIPDILVEYIDCRKEIIEVKPEYMLDEPVTILKLNAGSFYANQNGMSFRVMSEIDIFSGGSDNEDICQII